MFKRKSNAFTLIELIATLVIMAVIALIVTPLVMTIIRHAKLSADRRSIDAYGRSIELAIASHLLDTGKFATSIDELTIEYSGNQVECETTQINPDSSVYLSNCKVNNREVTNYTYGTDKSPSYESYQVGDHVSYNGVNYYVIEDSGAKNNVVKLLKENFIDYDEINGLIDCEIYPGHPIVKYGNSNDYATSHIKEIVDAWANSKIIINDLKEVRLMNIEELLNNFDIDEYEDMGCGGPCGVFIKRVSNKYSWMYGFGYYTMTPLENSSSWIYVVADDGIIKESDGIGYAIRPVVELYKTATITKLES